MAKNATLEKVLESIELEALEPARGGDGNRWRSAEGRDQIGAEFEECTMSANRGWLSKTLDWLWNGDNADTRTQGDCRDAYKKDMGIPR
jgi:hypothetical protein